MKVLKKDIKKGINILTIGYFDIDNYCDADKLKTIIKKLTQENQYYFECYGESFFLEEEEILKYRTEIPKYIKENGIYKLKRKCGEEHEESIGGLKITEEIYDQIIMMWDYFEVIEFFNPTSTLNWEKFEETYYKIRPVEYGIGLVKKNYANAVFTKGHDGDNLIFVYGPDYDESLVTQVIQIIENF
ncbi:hypothetical protein Q428_12460 [Fervidicella metallireducens AeB]|uniref:Uncharacterized protein n=1 Tax=Fervidicella metallireducens AeB TaxID=1403537 RepID=A0A017RSM9_9CLOT|nr:hypothetical protein [Fervidicella metallireducens]EYE87576.1 hypothetical protein Q428_12460 [Fervidicella metallireducens AeB]